MIGPGFAAAVFARDFALVTVFMVSIIVAACGAAYVTFRFLELMFGSVS
jgi:hypothetical protein